jgi:4-amino-4-deoxy-L-arabinose transferase-like glycosyltransferase
MSTANSPETTPGMRSESKTPSVAAKMSQPSRVVVAAVLLLLLVLFGSIRYRLCDMPLERDEGEYAYSGQLLLEGIPPYRLAYNMKLPGIYAAYTGMMKVFGEAPAGIHFGLLVVNAFTTLLLYWLAACLFGRLAGLVTAASWSLLSTSTSVMGFEAHATNFVVLPAILGIILLLYALERNSSWLLFAAGVAVGVGVVMKQHGIFFVLFCLIYLRIATRGKEQGIRHLLQSGAVFSAGAALPYAATCALLYQANVFPQFWFWTVSYASEYSKMGLRRAIRAFVENTSSVVAPAVLIWMLAAVGLTALWWGRGARMQRRFVIWFLICSFLSLCPGAYFRPHYFILILPVVAMLAGVAVSAVVEKLSERLTSGLGTTLPVLIFLICLGAGILAQRKAYFLMNPSAVFASSYQDSPFVATVQVADYVKAHTAPTDRIAVIGSEPEIYFYAQRHGATGYLYMYSLIVRQKYTARMREEFLNELKTNRPEYVVYVDVWDSWGERNVAQAEPFLAQLQKYMDNGFMREGVADIGVTTHYTWGPAAQDYRPHSSRVVYVLRRKHAG